MLRLLAPLLLIASLPSCVTQPITSGWSAGGLDRKTLVTLTQVGLRAHGYNKVSVDGAAGPETKAAARSFRKAKGLSPSGAVDAGLFEALFKDPDYSRPMPFIEGLVRACLRWGPANVLMLASNAGLVTCTVKGSRPATAAMIASARDFCRKSAGLQSDLAKCELLYDGRGLVDKRRLIELIRNPSPDVPVIVEATDSVSGKRTKINSVVRSEPGLSRFSLTSRGQVRSEPLPKPLRTRVIGPRGTTYCTGTATPRGGRVWDYSLNCIFSGERLEGRANMVGLVPVKGRLAPAYESAASVEGTRFRLTPPENTILFTR